MLSQETQTHFRSLFISDDTPELAQDLESAGEMLLNLADAFVTAGKLDETELLQLRTFQEAHNLIETTFQQVDGEIKRIAENN